MDVGSRAKQVWSAAVRNPTSVTARFVSQHKWARRSATLVCILGWIVVLGLVIYDVFLALDEKPGNTWSEQLRLYSERHLVFPWMLGGVLSHLFHHQDDLPPLGGRIEREDAFALGGILTTGMLIVGPTLYALTHTARQANPQLASWIMAGTTLLGMIAGYLLWPIKRNSEDWQW